MREPHWTWRRLRDFFAGGGKVEIPSGEDLLRDARIGASEATRKRPLIRWHAGLIGDAEGIRSMSPEELDRMNAAEEWIQAINRRLVEDMPMEIGVDLARGRDECWHIHWDQVEGKMIYRKIDPADMVRPSEGEEGIPDGEC